MIIFPEEKILILGDSVSHANKYVAFIEMLLAEELNVIKTDIINIGLSSETISGLSETTHPFPRPCVHSRLQKALNTIAPKVVIACYGMNDGIFHPYSEENFEAYRNGINKLIFLCKKMVVKIILITPPYFHAPSFNGHCLPLGSSDYSFENPYVDYAEVLENYGNWLKTLEKKGEVIKVIDIFHPLKEFVHNETLKNKSYKYGDAIHPCVKGHFVIAKTIFEKLFSYQLKTIPNFVETPESSPMFQLIEKRSLLKGNAWKSYIGFNNPYVIEDSLPIDELTKATDKIYREILIIKKN